MGGHDCRAAVVVPQEVMAAPSSNDLETDSAERRDELLAGDARQRGHFAMVSL